MQSGRPANQVEVVGFVDSQCFVNIAMRVDICSHGPIQRQAAEKHNVYLHINCHKAKIKSNVQIIYCVRPGDQLADER